MTAIELKYELFRDIESISDESVLQKIASYIKTFVNKSCDAKPLLYDPESGCYANEETIEAVEESMKGEYAGVVDCSNFESFKKSLGL
ncbi:MAG: hypothetical protein ACI3Y0_04565 [Prevotella sp.]